MLKKNIMLRSTWGQFLEEEVLPCIWNVKPIHHNMCMVFIPPLGFWKKIRFPLFLPTTNLQNWFPPFKLELSKHFFKDKFYKLWFLHRYHCKNITFYHLSMICTICLQRSGVVCCHRQILKKSLLICL